MLKFIANLFGVKHTAPTAPVPYKVEAPVAEAKKPTVKKATTREPKAESGKKPVVKAKTARKPRTPKA